MAFPLPLATTLSSRLGRCARSFCVAAWLCGSGFSLRASPAHAESTLPRRVVLLVASSGSGAPPQATLEAIRTLLAELPVTLVVSPRAAPLDLAKTSELARSALAESDAMAAVWLELEGQVISVYFYE